MWTFSNDGYALRHLAIGSRGRGLRDTVQAYNVIDGSGTGFSFNNLSGYWLNWAVDQALTVYTHDKNAWYGLQREAMSRDFSWDTASQHYADLYQSL